MKKERRERKKERRYESDSRVWYLCLAYSLSGLLNFELEVGRIFRILFPLKSYRDIKNVFDLRGI